MATSVLESIAANMLTTLQGVTTTGGYDNTLIAERAKQFGNEPLRDKLAVIHQGSPALVEGENSPHQHVTWRQPFIIVAFVIESESSNTAIDTRINSIRADIEKAVMVAPTRGGYAIDTIIREPELFATSNGEVAGVAVNIEILYRTLITSPYTQ